MLVSQNKNPDEQIEDLYFHETLDNITLAYVVMKELQNQTQDQQPAESSNYE